MYRVLIIEDEVKIANELSILLRTYGFEVIVVEDFTNVLNQIEKSETHLILLDVNLPYNDGYYVLRELRKFSDVPVILVTSRDTEIDEIASINLGADDFITKPYNSNILLARTSRLIKRTYEVSNVNKLIYEGLELNISTSTLRYNENEIEMSRNESRVMEFLILNKGRIVSRNEIIEALWQTDQFIDDNTLTVNMSRIRKKLYDLGLSDLIITMRGQGYIIK